MATPTTFVPFDQLYQGAVVPLVPQTNGVWTLSGTREVIRSSIMSILLTLPGERVLLPTFGSKLWFLVGEPNDEVLGALARIYTVDAIEAWENRIRITNVRAIVDENTFAIQISYFIKTTQQPDLLTLEFPRTV